MKKIQLHVEELQVESFETMRDGAARRGTVRARGYTEEPVWDCEVQSASGPIRCVCNSDPRWGTCDSCNPDYTCPDFTCAVAFTCGDLC